MTTTLIEPVILRDDITGRDDSLAHIGDRERDYKYGICGARIKGIPANPAPDRQCRVCVEMLLGKVG